MRSGWIKLHRKLLDHWLYRLPQKFSQRDAFIYILLRANYSLSNSVIAGRSMLVERGQLLTTQVELAGRWGWHRETVKAFLERLRDDGMFDFKTGKGSGKKSGIETPTQLAELAAKITLALLQSLVAVAGVEPATPRI
jgi:hypothetical protein